MRKPDVVIVAEGGLVRDVYCTNPDQRIVIIDWDEDLLSGDRCVIEIETGDMAHVRDEPAQPLDSIDGTRSDEALALHLLASLE